MNIHEYKETQQLTVDQLEPIEVDMHILHCWVTIMLCIKHVTLSVINIELKDDHQNHNNPRNEGRHDHIMQAEKYNCYNRT